MNAFKPSQDSESRYMEARLSLLQFSAMFVTVLFFLTFAPAVGANGTGDDLIKWDQPPSRFAPTNVFLGWNEPSVYGTDQIAADDWACVTTNPVTIVRWWGSFIGWSEPTIPGLPSAFMIQFWTDAPAGVENPFSHPGEVIWQVQCTNFTVEFARSMNKPRRRRRKGKLPSVSTKIPGSRLCNGLPPIGPCSQAGSISPNDQ